MKSILLSVAAATMLWVGGAMTSSADAQYVRYGRGYSAPRYYNNYAPRYYSGYSTPYRTYYRGGYNAPYYSGYRGGYYGGGYGGYYGGGYYQQPGVSVGVGPARIGIGF